MPRKVCKQAPEGGRDGLSGQPMTSEQCGFIEVEAGTGLLSAEEYDAAVYDLVNFLDGVSGGPMTSSSRVSPRGDS